MSIQEKTCSCALTRDGRKAGCSSLTVVDTEHGPRFRESACNRGDATEESRIDAMYRRADERARAAYEAGPPRHSSTRVRQ